MPADGHSFSVNNFKLLTLQMFLIIVLPVAVAMSAVVSFYLYRKYYAHQLFAKEGIPGPRPHWLYGNMREFSDEHTRHLALPNWSKQYGKIYGFFEGSKPVLVTSDASIVAQVFVKQFQSFHKRKSTPKRPNSDLNAAMTNSMFMADGERWKRLRTIANPTFSAAKMKALMPLMHKCQADFMELIDNKAKTNQAFNIFSCFKLLTLDTISETAFGVEVNCSKSNANSGENDVNLTSNPIMKAIDAMFSPIFKRPALLQLQFILPEIAKELYLFWRLKTLAFEKVMVASSLSLLEIVKHVVEVRRANKDSTPKRQDLLQMMMDVEHLPQPNNHHQNAELKGLTTDELSGQSILFMIAGYETSSNALAFTAFLLANHPEIQDKLLEDIDQVKMGDLADYESVNSMAYLDCVVNESLRLFPVAPLIIGRQAAEESVVNGIMIPKDVTIMADVWAIHRDEEQWGPVDPEQFHPERFMDDYPTKESRNEAAFMPFGFGPRICIGMRFALLEIKLTLVNILRKYRFEKTVRTGDTLKLKAGNTITPSEGVYVKLARRS